MHLLGHIRRSSWKKKKFKEEHDGRWLRACEYPATVRGHTNAGTAIAMEAPAPYTRHTLPRGWAKLYDEDTGRWFFIE